jgi:hypothetical protein
MAESVTIPISLFEFSVDYKRPEFRLWTDRASVLQAVFEALSPWDPRVDDVDAVTTGKASEQGVVIKLPLKRVSFFFGPASCRFTRDNVDWQTVDETISILDSAISALTSLGGVVLGRKISVVSLHVQPKSVPFSTLLKPLIAPRILDLLPEPVDTMATVAKWQNYKVTIDGSAMIANAVFLRSEREFGSEATYDEIVARLRDDQIGLFGLLGVTEEKQ